MPAAGSPALCAAQGNYYCEGDACGRGLALCAAQGNHYCEGDACGRWGWHFVQPRAITIARGMSAAGVAGLGF